MTFFAFKGMGGSVHDKSLEVEIEVEEQDARRLVTRLFDASIRLDGGGDRDDPAETGENELPPQKRLATASSKISSQCTWDGSRHYKRTMVDACKQKGARSAISTARLRRVQEAAAQIKANREAAQRLRWRLRHGR